MAKIKAKRKSFNRRKWNYSDHLQMQANGRIIAIFFKNI